MIRRIAREKNNARITHSLTKSLNIYIYWSRDSSFDEISRFEAVLIVIEARRPERHIDEDTFADVPCAHPSR